MIKEPPSKSKSDKLDAAASDIITEIPTDKLKEFVGPVDNLLKISATLLWDNRFRINVWTEKYEKNAIFPTFSIDKSFFVHYNNGVIIDQTIQPKPKGERIF